MAAGAKFILVLIAAVSLAVSPLSPFLLVATLALFSLIALSSRLRPGRLMARNTLVFLFAFFFMTMAAISAIVRGQVPSYAVAELGIRIVLVFNAVFLGGRWIGAFGLLRIIDAVPSERVRLFMILLIKRAHSLLAANRTVVDQLISRLDMTQKDRRVIARYYIQNMIFRELRSIRYLQAALYTRLPGTLCVYHRPAIFRGSDFLIATAALLCAAAAFLPPFGPPWFR